MGKVLQSGGVADEERGPWHGERLRALHFINDGLLTRYDENGVYRGTYNRIRWQGADGNWETAEIGDDRPLVLNGYRIFATVHRGLSPLFRWEPEQGVGELGTVQLADHREGDMPPSASWQLPGGPEVWAQLAHAPLERPVGRVQQNLRAGDLQHGMVVRVGDDRWELRPGESVALPGGTLTYVELSAWMSYRLVYDPATPWLMATIVVAVVSLVAFYWRRIVRHEDRA